MKIKLAISALALTLSTSAMAYNFQGDDMLCEHVREGSQDVMEFRQRGNSLDKALSPGSAVFSEAITIEAYTYPIVQGITNKVDSIINFGSAMYRVCMAGYMEYDEAGDMKLLL